MTDETKRPKSRYAVKRASGKMMYGPGCCGHSLSQKAIDDAKRDGEIRRRMERFDSIVRRAERSQEDFA